MTRFFSFKPDKKLHSIAKTANYAGQIPSYNDDKLNGTNHAKDITRTAEATLNDKLSKLGLGSSKRTPLPMAQDQ